MNIFARITKVDEAKRLVIGRAVQEVADKADEVFDYASSKPLFQEWSAEFEKATDGASLGNIRAMHGKVAAGKVTQITFDDAEKAIDVATKIVDDAEWKKVLEGVYTGFSIGGSYVNKWADEEKPELTRYTAKPAEISIVDSPCVPTARFFEICKSDGSTAQVEFKGAPIAADKADAGTSADAAGAGGAAADDEGLVVTGSDADVASFAKALNDAGMTMAQAAELVKREFSQAERDKAADSGAALPDGSYPIKTKADLKNAIQAFGRAKDKAKVKAHIKARAKALGATDMLPEDWGKAEVAVDVEKLDKGLYAVQRFADALSCIAGICCEAEADAQWEGDGSPVPEALRGWVAEGVKIFQDMADEESEELLASLASQTGAGSAVLSMSAPVRMLRKRLTDPDIKHADFWKAVREYLTPEEIAPIAADAEKLIAATIAKAGARHSKDDMVRLQAAHDHLADMGAKCYGGEEKATGNADLSKLNAEVTTLRDEINKLKAQPVATKVHLRAVSKGQDIGGGAVAATDTAPEINPEDFVYMTDGNVNVPATIVKFSQRNGRPVDPRLQLPKP